MALTDPHAPGATPLRDEDIRGLKHAVTTHAELNELEAANIVQGQEWALASRKTKIPDMLSDEYLQLLHLKMYGEVWAWAGKYRDHDTNLGVPFPNIRTELRQVFDDAIYWVDKRTYPPDELAIRLHHRLVWVHPFPNGNGRLTRLLADLLLLKHFGAPRLPWGGSSLGANDTRRQTYIQALSDADHHNYAPVIAFCKGSLSFDS